MKLSTSSVGCWCLIRWVIKWYIVLHICFYNEGNPFSHSQMITSMYCTTWLSWKRSVKRVWVRVSNKVSFNYKSWYHKQQFTPRGFSTCAAQISGRATGTSTLLLRLVLLMCDLCVWYSGKEDFSKGCTGSPLPGWRSTALPYMHVQMLLHHILWPCLHQWLWACH